MKLVRSYCCTNFHDSNKNSKVRTKARHKPVRPNCRSQFVYSKQKHYCVIILLHQISRLKLKQAKTARFEIGATIWSQRFHDFNQTQARWDQDRRPKTLRPYCRSDLSFETKTLLCDHIVAPIPRLKLKQQKSEIRNWCDHNVTPIPRFKQKQARCDQDRLPKTLWPYCRTNSSFETKSVLCDHIIAPISRLKLETAKNRDKKLNHIVTPIVFWQPTLVLCDHIVASILRLKLNQLKSEIWNWCDHIVAPIRLL